jgi:thioredoxin reductase (NADPH)
LQDVIIIGAGPAGLAAAIQLKRSGLEPLVFEKNAPGGLLRNANLVENYLGFPGGIPGPELAQLMRRQAEETGVEIVFEEILRADYIEGAFTLRSSAREVRTGILVMASGTQPKPLPLPHPESAMGKTIFYEVYPLLNLENESVVVLGAGDAAFDYALHLAKRNNRVTILFRGAASQCLLILEQRVQENKLITCRNHGEVLRIEENGKHLDIIYREGLGEGRLETRYLLVAFGREPSLGFLGDNLKVRLDDLSPCGKLYLIGDVANGNFRQAALAAGEGIRCGMKIAQQLGRKVR